MKPYLPIFILLFTIVTAKAQNVDFYGNAVAKDVCGQLGMKDDQEATDCMNKICDAADIPNNFTLQPCPNINNCYAISVNDISYIVYDLEFFNKVKSYGFTEKNLPGKNIDWSALTILAHELGHHLCQHFTKNVRERYTPVEMELQADEYAGTIMYKLGATLAQAQQVMNSGEVPEEASLTHPARKARLDAIARGWNKEYNKNQNKNQGGVSPGGNASVVNQPKTTITIPDMALVQGGSFTMGNAAGENNEKPAHEVTISNFYIGKYEVTVADFRKFIQATGYVTNAERNKRGQLWDGGKWVTKPGINWQFDLGGNRVTADEENEPVVNVSWDDCMRYCQWMSEKTGARCRLPTEAEWEYAARGGNKSKGYVFSGSNKIDESGWFGGNSINAVHAVGQKQPNELGLYDMTGNAAEWCSDLFDNNYYRNSATMDPEGASTGGSRSVRGGSCLDLMNICTVTHRHGNSPGNYDPITGFRLVVSGDASLQLQQDASSGSTTGQAQTPASPPVVDNRVAPVASGGYNGNALKKQPFSHPYASPSVANQSKTAIDLSGMMLAQGGTFSMGSNDGESWEKPVHTVTVSSFYISKYEVTVAEFRKFIEAAKYMTTADLLQKSVVWGGAKWEEKAGVNWQCDLFGNRRPPSQDNEPVVHVSWDDCQAYCRWMSAQTGKKFRLPTEAEWEYAARGGQKSNSYQYSGGNNIDETAWYNGNSANATHPVGQKQANELGLYDMAGNVWEWCSDWYNANYYSGSPAQNPQGPPAGTARVVRGGCLSSAALHCRVSDRGNRLGVFSYGSVGFRPVFDL